MGQGFTNSGGNRGPLSNFGSFSPVNQGSPAQNLSISALTKGLTPDQTNAIQSGPNIGIGQTPSSGGRINPRGTVPGLPQPGTTNMNPFGIQMGGPLGGGGGGQMDPFVSFFADLFGIDPRTFGQAFGGTPRNQPRPPGTELRNGNFLPPRTGVTSRNPEQLLPVHFLPPPGDPRNVKEKFRPPTTTQPTDLTQDDVFFKGF